MDKFSQILFNWFTQNPTGRDEREQGVLEHKLAVMFLLTYITIVILGTISLVIDMKRETVNFGTICLLALSVILTFVSLWINRRNRLDELKAHSAEEYKQWVKKHAIKCSFFVVYFATVMFIITGLSSLIFLMTDSTSRTINQMCIFWCAIRRYHVYLLYDYAQKEY